MKKHLIFTLLAVIVFSVAVYFSSFLVATCTFYAYVIIYIIRDLIKTTKI